VTKLLERDITKRFGLLKRGVADITSHCLFDGYDWAKMPGASTKLLPPNMKKGYTGKWVPLSQTADLQLESDHSQSLSEKENAMFAAF
jgi:hypothetical protein